MKFGSDAQEEVGSGMGRTRALPGDLEFPQLREVLDPQRLMGQLREHMGAGEGGRVELQDCSIEQFHYKRGGGVRFVCRVAVRQGRKKGEQTFFGRLSRAGLKARRRGSRAVRDLARPAFGPPYIRIPEWGVELWAYPNDPDLPGLAFMHDAERALAYFRAGRARFGLAAPPVRAAAEMIKHVAGKRCGVLFRIELPSANGHRGAATTLYGKAYRPDQGEAAYRIMKRIWECGPRRKGAFILPQPYAYDRATGIVWQEALPGRPIAKGSGAGDRLPEAAGEIGERLAGLHRARLELPARMGFHTQVAWLRSAIRTLREAYPDHAEICGPVTEKLLRAARSLERGPLTVVHGSFKLSHILATEKGLAFIDFDGTCLGDPTVDLGRFIAHVLKMSASGKLSAELAERTVDNFCNAYNRAARSPIPRRRIEWAAACHLIGGTMDKSVKRMDPRSTAELTRIADHLFPG
jgi:hypothetical protein